MDLKTSRRRPPARATLRKGEPWCARDDGSEQALPNAREAQQDGTRWCMSVHTAQRTDDILLVATELLRVGMLLRNKCQHLVQFHLRRTSR